MEDVMEGLPKSKWLRFLLYFTPIKTHIMSLDYCGSRHITKVLFRVTYCIKQPDRYNEIEQRFYK